MKDIQSSRYIFNQEFGHARKGQGYSILINKSKPLRVMYSETSFWWGKQNQPDERNVAI
jgi:hypothetical protein